MPPKYSALELPSELTSSPPESGTCRQLRNRTAHRPVIQVTIRTKTLPLGRVLSIRSGCEKAARCPGERPCRSDAWLSCAGPGELAPEVGNSEPVNMIQGRLVPPSIRAHCVW